MQPEVFLAFGKELCKEAGLGDLWNKFTDMFRGRKAKAQQKADFLLAPNINQELRWKNLPRNAGSLEFVEAINKHKDADQKLRSHVQSMHELTKGKTIGKVESSGGGGKSYEIKLLPSKNYGCTCNDWRYKGTTNPGYKCKHILKFEAGQSKLAASIFDKFRKKQIEKELELEKERRNMNDGPFSNMLLQDEIPENLTYDASQLDEPEIILG